tara:strand:+ start:3665 stop:4777 length:1113 start_codon:yes stop_codon:yes gene_type:complete
MASVTVWRKDTPGGETFDDDYAQSEGYANAEAFARHLIANAGYSDEPVRLHADFGGGMPVSTGNEISYAAPQGQTVNSSTLESVLGDYFDAAETGDAIQTGPSTFEQAKGLFPYLDDRLIRLYLDKYNESGNERLAMAEMRADPLTAEVYPGIKREDGSLRMTEQEYVAAVDNMQGSLRKYNLNPTEFADDITEAIAGDVAPLEWSQRLDAGYEQIVNNIPQVKEAYLENFGINLPDESIFAMFVSPTVGKKIYEGQIRASQVIGEASAAGFANISAEVAQSLQAQGLTQDLARKGFGAASVALTGIQTAARSQGRDTVTATDYVQATQLGDARELRNIQQIVEQLQTGSSFKSGPRQSQTGEVTGLTET